MRGQDNTGPVVRNIKNVD